jgi:hypothetical protein
VKSFAETVVGAVAGVGGYDFYGGFGALQLFCGRDEAPFPGVIFHGDSGSLFEEAAGLAAGERQLELTADLSQAVLDFTRCVVDGVFKLASSAVCVVPISRRKKLIEESFERLQFNGNSLHLFGSARRPLCFKGGQRIKEPHIRSNLILGASDTLLVFRCEYHALPLFCGCQDWEGRRLFSRVLFFVVESVEQGVSLDQKANRLEKSF